MGGLLALAQKRIAARMGKQLPEHRRELGKVGGKRAELNAQAAVVPSLDLVQAPLEQLSGFPGKTALESAQCLWPFLLPWSLGGR